MLKFIWWISYNDGMNKLAVFALYFTLTLVAVQAQTIGSALVSVEQSSREVASRQVGESWGVQTASEDLSRLLAQAQRLSVALESGDARQVEGVQRDFTSAAQRVETSRVLLDAEEQRRIEEILATVDQIDERLTGLRLRFGGQANLVPGSLAEVSLKVDSPLDRDYTNIEDLLIDVRDARRLAGSLGRVRFPPYGFNRGGLYFIDPQQLDRFVRAGWALERELSGSSEDISASLSAWSRFEREYQRLGFLGSDSNGKRLERVMQRLGDFYDSQEL